MADRSSRPHHSPARTPTRTERRIVKVRVLRRWGPARIGYLLGLHPSTVHRVLTRYRMARLRWLDRDGHSRLAYSELLSDERKETAAAFWRRANAWFSECGIIVGKVLTDNGSCYRSHAFKDALEGIEHRRTRPYRPQTNGKVERFHRTLADEWAYARLYTSDTERCDQFPIWLHTYNHHRGHTALGGQPPASRVPNLSGQYN